MANYSYTLFFIALPLFVVREMSCTCGCGCGGLSNYRPYASYDNLGVKTCEDDFIPPLEIQKPICPPPPSVCKELGIEAQPPCYPPPPSCSRGSWVQLLPKCLRKRIRHPFCISRANLLNQKLAFSNMRTYYGSGFNLTPLGGYGCGC